MREGIALGNEGIGRVQHSPENAVKELIRPPLPWADPFEQDSEKIRFGFQLSPACYEDILYVWRNTMEERSEREIPDLPYFKTGARRGVGSVGSDQADVLVLLGEGMHTG
jgi:hypothetical protein